jgi:hypothetical protein
VSWIVACQRVEILLVGRELYLKTLLICFYCSQVLFCCAVNELELFTLRNRVGQLYPVVNVLVAEVCKLEGEVSAKSEQDMLRPIVLCVLLNASDELVRIPFELLNLLAEYVLHVVIVALIDPHINSATALVHLVHEMCKDSGLLGGLGTTWRLPLGSPHEFHHLVLFAPVFLRVGDSGKEQRVKAHALEKFGCSSGVAKAVDQPGNARGSHPKLVGEEVMAHLDISN